MKRIKRPENPFNLTGYYGEKYFCDRKKELEVLNDHFQNGRNVVMYGWRRMGKTALIKRSLEVHEDSGHTDTLYIDLLTTENMEEAIRAITQSVYHKYGKTKAGLSSALKRMFSAVGVTLTFDPLSGVPEVSMALNQTGVPESSLTAIGQFLSERKSNVVLALDEFQKIAEYQSNTAEAIFRNWMQEYPSLRFLFSGSHRGIMESMFADRSRAFYKSTQLMAIDSIPIDSFTTFIQNHFEENDKSISKEMVYDIYHWSRGQTYAVQLICNYLFGRCTVVTKEDFVQVVGDILDQESSMFINYQNILPVNEWEVICAIAREEKVSNPTGKDFVMGQGLGAASSVQRALQSLVRKEMVVRENDGYMVHDIILSRWLERW